jgi:dipeptidyl aminopeptidase/acylaminoacyl peptidase
MIETTTYFKSFLLKALIGAFMLHFTSAVFGIDRSEIEPFAKKSEFGKTRISPDGKFIAVKTTRDDREVIVILKTSSLTPSHVVRFVGENDQVGNFQWVSDNRLIVGVSRFSKSRMERAGGGGELFAVNADGSKGKRIFTYSLGSNERKRKNSGLGFGGYAFMVAPLRDEPKYALINACGFGGSCELYRINVYNGSLRDRQKLPNGVGYYSPAILDDDNRAVYAVGQTDFGFREVYGKTGSDWELLGKYPYPGGMLMPISVTEDGKAAYALDDRDGGPQKLVKASRSLDQLEVLNQHRLTDVRGYHGDSEGRLYAVEVGLGLTELVVLEPDHPDLPRLKMLRAAFPGKIVDIVDDAQDGRILLIAAYSDRSPVAYYLFDTEKNQVRFLWSRRPWVDEAESAAMEVVEFSSRDGLTITGYLTLPSGASSDNRAPLIVNPHGGPHGPYDTWSYNQETQFLASQGYAVLQVNFRGSGGFGSGFEMAGFRKWGREIQFDIIDGAQFALKNYPLDPNRVGIMGASFGGYSSLQSSILAPDLFKAAVGVVGVYDFRLMYTAGDIRGRFSGRRYLEKAIGEDPSEFYEYSPVRRAHELQTPVLLIQGEKDERAPTKHSDVLAEVLRANEKVYEYVVMENEGHGFDKLENRIRYYDLFATFFDRYLAEIKPEGS